MQITINGRVCAAEPGQTVLQAARANGIYIPSLCYYKQAGPLTKCRACVVEVQGMRGIVTSCNTPVQEGMVVTTDSPTVREAQKFVVDLLLASGDHDCLSCEQNGACELQQAAYYLGIEMPSFKFDTINRRKDVSSEFIQIDRSKCILCGRCVEVCQQGVVNRVLGFQGRGFATEVGFDLDAPMGESTCVQCGACVQACPVGAIIDKRAVQKGRAWELRQVETVCPYCGVGCQVTLHLNDQTGQIVKVTGVEDSPTNDGMLCVKGRYGFDFVNSPERLTTPLVRDAQGQLQEAAWDTAIRVIADKFTQIKHDHGPDAIAGLCSAKVTNEENFAFQKFMRREIGTNNVDHCARL